jgi:hypothetical protein
VDLDSAIAAKWCRKHKMPPLSPEAKAGLLDLSKMLLQAIHAAAASPPPEVRVYYQSMKFILRVAEGTLPGPDIHRHDRSRRPKADPATD